MVSARVLAPVSSLSRSNRCSASGAKSSCTRSFSRIRVFSARAFFSVGMVISPGNTESATGALTTQRINRSVEAGAGAPGV